MQNKCYWPYVSNLAGSFSKFFLTLPLRKNLLGLKHKANNVYFAFIRRVLLVGKQFATAKWERTLRKNLLGSKFKAINIYFAKKLINWQMTLHTFSTSFFF